MLAAAFVTVGDVLGTVSAQPRDGTDDGGRNHECDNDQQQ
jgi:hypothetical protein